jgi:hypothetical protein
LIVIIRIEMPEHGDYDTGLRRWYCNYWQSSKEWEDIHDYSPSDASAETTDDPSNRVTSEKLEK